MTYPAHARRQLSDVLSPAVLRGLQDLCVQHVAPKAAAEDRMVLLSSMVMADDRWRPIVATALATEPDVVEGWLLGCPPMPGSLERRSERTGIRSFEAAAHAEQVHRDQVRHRAQQVARHRAQQPHPDALPQDWCATARAAATVQQVASALGMAERHRALGPCPACHEQTRGHHDRRPPVGVRREGSGWRCHRCHEGGDAIHLVAWSLLGTRTWTDRAGRETVGRWFADHGWC